MSTAFNCEDKDTLVAYLYDEIDDALRREMRTHLRTCAACAAEVDALQAVRRDLPAWQPPETELNFAIVQKPATVLQPSRWSRPSLPAWAQVAAAVLVFAAGAAVANVQVRYGSDGLTVTTGWLPSTVAAPGVSQADPAGLKPSPTTEERARDDWRPAFTALESELRRELQMVRSTQAASARPAVAPADIDTNAVLRQVRALVNESEERQRQELALRMTQFGRDVRTDLIRMNQGFRQLQERTGMVESSQRGVMSLMRRVSTQQVP
jgi:hypothetical protein